MKLNSHRNTGVPNRKVPYLPVLSPRLKWLASCHNPDLCHSGFSLPLGSTDGGRQVAILSRAELYAGTSTQDGWSPTQRPVDGPPKQQGVFADSGGI